MKSNCFRRMGPQTFGPLTLYSESNCNSSLLHVCPRQHCHLCSSSSSVSHFCCTYSTPPPPSLSLSLLDVPFHSRCTQTVPGFTWRQTVTHVIKWTRDYLFGVHQSSGEFKELTKSSKTPLKVEPRGVVWSILRMSGYTPLDTVADELVPSVHAKSHLQAGSNSGDGIEHLHQSSVSEKSWRPPKITLHPGKAITSEWIVWKTLLKFLPPQTRPGEVGWIEQDLICERSG